MSTAGICRSIIAMHYNNAGLDWNKYSKYVTSAGLINLRRKELAEIADISKFTSTKLHWYKPKSLIEFEANNGWIRCEDELPTDGNLLYTVWRKDGLDSLVNHTIDGVEILYKKGTITHWRVKEDYLPPTH